MAADIEWIGVRLEGRSHADLRRIADSLGGRPLGLVRAGKAYRSHRDGDPYESGCLLTDQGMTAHLWFAHAQPQRHFKAVVKALRRHGFSWLCWSRDASRGLREARKWIG